MPGLSRRSLHTKKMFDYVFKKGRCYQKTCLTLRIAHPSAEGEFSRAGYILRKSNGNAVFRNLVRRILRRAFQNAFPGFSQPSWVLFDLRPGRVKASIRDIRKTAEELLRSA